MPTLLSPFIRVQVKTIIIDQILDLHYYGEMHMKPASLRNY
jgi:hypothetical protein